MAEQQTERSSDSSSDTDSTDSDEIPNFRPCTFCAKKFNVNKCTAHENTCMYKREATTWAAPDGTIKFLCKTCGQTFKYVSGLSRHEERHQFPGGFICKICKARFLTEFDRTGHREEFHKKFKCNICEAKFQDEKYYLSHIKDVHDGRDREYFICTDCGQQFKTALQLRYHNDSKCGTYKSYCCDKCDAKFMTQNTLNAHNLIHVGEKKHLCNYCGNSFLSKGQLKVHERQHTGEKPFKCEICSKAFSYRESLVTHSSLHTGIKPYLCEGCGSRFSCIGNLIKHRKARPDSCGLPQFCKNTKIAPRASAKNPGSLTMKPPKPEPKYRKGRGPYKKKVISETKTDETNIDETITDETNIDETKTDETNIDEAKTNEIKKTAEVGTTTKSEKSTKRTRATKTTNPETKIETIEMTETSEIQMTQAQINALIINKEEYIIEFTDLTDLENKDFIDDNSSVQLQTGIEFQFPGTTTVVHRADVLKCDKSIQVNDFSENEPFQSEFYNYIQPENDSYTESNWNESHEVSFQDDDDDVFDQIIEEAEIKSEVNSQDLKFDPPNDTLNLNVTEDEESDEDVPLSSFRHTNINNKTRVQRPRKSKRIKHKVIKENSDLEGTYNELISLRKAKLRRVKEIFSESYDSESEYEISDNDPDFIPSKIIKTEKNKVQTNIPFNKIISTEEFTNSQLDPNELFAETKIDKDKEIDKRPFKCIICPADFKRKTRLVKHLLSEHRIKERKPFSCKFCEKKYFSTVLLERHQVVHGDDGLLQHKCSCCNEYFKTPADCEKHQIEKHEDKLVCQECKKIFKDPDNLKQHLRNSHKETPTLKKYFYMCPKCGKNFTSKIALSDHERSNCGMKPIYICDICNKAYHSAGSLKTHQTIHSGELPHLCTCCGKGFRTQGQVKVHMRRHNGERPFKCEFCAKSFAYRESLLTHRSLHTGLKRFMCQSCGSRFSCISNLQAHRKSHRNTCGSQPNCTKAFGPMGVIENVSPTFNPDKK